MRFLRRYSDNQFQLVSTGPKAKRFAALEIWKAWCPRTDWECRGSLDVRNPDLGRHLIVGFGTLVSLRYVESLPSRYLQLWAGHRALVACWDRSGI